MPDPEPSDETTVDGENSITVPAEIRRRLDVGPGDTLRWTLLDGGEIRVELADRPRSLEDLDPIDVGEETNAVEDTEELAYEGRRWDGFGALADTDVPGGTEVAHQRLENEFRDDLDGP